MKIGYWIVIVCLLNIHFVDLMGQSAAVLKVRELDSLYRVNYEKGDLEAAEFSLLEGLEVRKKTLGVEHEITLEAGVNLAGFYQEIGALDDAERVYKRLIPSCKKVYGANDQKYALVLFNAAVVQNDLGDYHQALEFYEQVQDISLKNYNKHHISYVYALEGLATTCYNLTRYEEAASYYREVLNLQADKFGKDHPQYAFTLSNLASVYQATDRTREAIKLIKQALFIQGNALGKEDDEYANSLNTLAVLYIKQKRYEEAEKTIEQVLTIMENKLGKEHPWYLNAQVNLTSLWIRSGYYEKAEQLCKELNQKQLKLFGKKHPSYINSLGLMAKVYLNQKRLDLALDYAMKTLDATLSDGYHVKQFSDDFIAKIPTLKYDYQLKINYVYDILITILHDYYKQTNHVKWLRQRHEVIKNVIALNQQFRNAFTFEEDKYVILKDVATFIHQGMESSHELHAMGEQGSYVGDAFLFAEQNKSMLLLDALKSRQRRTFGNLPDSLLQKEKKLQRQKSVLQKRLLETTTTSERTDVRSELNDLKHQISHFKDGLKKDFPRYFETKYGRTKNSVETIQQLLDDKTLLLEYFVADTVVYLFALGQNKLELKILPIDKLTLKRQVTQFRKALSKYSFIIKHKGDAWDLYTTKAHWFYQNLLAPALKDIKGIEKLIIIPDYELGHLPFEAFLVEEPDKQQDYKEMHYLLNDFLVSYNYSAILWKETIDNPVDIPNNNLLACAALYEHLDEERILEKRGNVLGTLRNSLKKLKAAEREVKALAEVFGGDFVTGEATSEAFFKEHAKNYGIIHLAMHGVLNDEAPILSSLAFTETMGNEEDNFLQAYEISQMQLNAEMVVLSACETGLGKFEQGEGVLSLARSFMYAGVPSLVVSLWQVHDLSTAVLMQQFYANLSKGMSKADALRQAKIMYIDNVKGITAHPAFWSPFIQLGDSSPIQIKSRWWWLWWLLGTIVIIVVGRFLWQKRQEKNLAKEL